MSDRDTWHDPSGLSLTGTVVVHLGTNGGFTGVFSYSLMMAGAREDFADGLKAFAFAWFSSYEDETDLPAWFAQAIKDAEDIGLDPLDIPSQDDDEDEAKCDFVLDPEGMGVSCDAPAPHCIGGTDYRCDEHYEPVES